MDTRELLNMGVLILLLQVGVGVTLFLLTSGAPGVNFYSIGISILLLVGVSSGIGVVLYWLVKRYSKERAIKTAMLAMSDDEKEVLREIMRNGEIRQDELRKNLGFSKSKVSALVNNLKEKNAVEKSRYKRTNLLKPTEEFRR